MKFSKILMVAAVGMCGLLMAVPSIAQNSEAVNADDVLEPKIQPKQSPSGQSTSDAEETELEKSIAEAKAELEDKDVLAKKIELAKKMHEIRPTRLQVDTAVKRAANALPAYERQNFIIAMQSYLNYNAIERISIDSMVETYTLKELDSMVGYYSKPEAKSASLKVNSWAKAVHPEIARMIDRAMMRIRTGQ